MPLSHWFIYIFNFWPLLKEYADFLCSWIIIIWHEMIVGGKKNTQEHQVTTDKRQFPFQDIESCTGSSGVKFVTKKGKKIPAAFPRFVIILCFCKICDFVLFDDEFTTSRDPDDVAHAAHATVCPVSWHFANLGAEHENTIKGNVSGNVKITGVRGDSMICSTGELYRKLLPPFRTVITLCSLSLLLLLQGACYRLSRIGSNWNNVSVHLTAVKLLQTLQCNSVWSNLKVVS